MPLVRIDMFPGRSVEQKREITKVLTQDLARIAKCRPEAVTRDVQRGRPGRLGASRQALHRRVSIRPGRVNSRAPVSSLTVG